MTSPKDTITYTFKTDERDATRGLKKLAEGMEDVDKLSLKLRKSQQGQADAAGRLRVAESRLAELRSTGKAKASQLAAAEESVAAARRKLATAADDARRSSLSLGRAQESNRRTSLAAAQAQTQASRATTSLAKAQDRTGESAKRAERDVRRLGRAADDGGRGFVSMRKSVGGVSLGIGQALHGIAPFGVSLGAVGALTVGLGAKLYGTAARLELMDRKSRIVFGSSFPKLAAWAKTVSTQFGLTSREVLGLTVGFADMLVPMGFTRVKAAGLAQQFAKMAPILAQWSGGQFDTSQAAEALTGALTGEYDTLQRLGIPISDALVRGEALRLGLVKTTVDTKNLSLAQQRASLAQTAYNKAVKEHGADSEQARRASIALQVATAGVEKAAAGSNIELSAAAKAQAALSLIMSGSTDAQAAFAKGQGTLAAKSAAARARFGELRDTLIVAMIPALDKLGKWFVDHQDEIIDFGFKAARGFITFGENASLAVAGILDGVGDFTIGLGNLLKASNATFEGVLRGAAIALGFINPSAAKAAQGAIAEFNRLRMSAGNDLIDIGTKAKATADGIRRNVPPAADLARRKLEELRRAALGLPPNPQIKPTVPTYSKAAASLNDLRHKGEWLTNHPYSVSVAVRIRGVDVTSARENARAASGTAAGGKAYGGWVPGHSPGDYSDNIPATVQGQGRLWLTGKEFVVKRPTARKLERRAPGFLDALNEGKVDVGGDVGVMRARAGRPLGRARGGSVPEVQRFIRAQDPEPYIWGGTGPYGWDCSGITGGAYGMLKGQSPYRRYFTTASNFESLGFRRGLGAFTIGVTPGRGHMVGQLGGLKFEARSTAAGILTGSAATSPTRMARQFYLPQVGGQFGVDGLTARQIHQTVALMRPQIIDRVFRQLGVRQADRGGVLLPGQAAVNASARPEMLRSAAEEDRLLAEMQGLRADLARMPSGVGREVGLTLAKFQGGRR